MDYNGSMEDYRRLANFIRGGLSSLFRRGFAYGKNDYINNIISDELNRFISDEHSIDRTSLVQLRVHYDIWLEEVKRFRKDFKRGRLFWEY